MKKVSLIGATLLGAAMLRGTPVPLHWSQDKTLSVDLDSAYAIIGRPATPESVAGVGGEQPGGQSGTAMQGSAATIRVWPSQAED